MPDRRGGFAQGSLLPPTPSVVNGKCAEAIDLIGVARDPGGRSVQIGRKMQKRQGLDVGDGMLESGREDRKAGYGRCGEAVIETT